ncbi:hypothetical protein A2Y85_00195 [candidate division WOR-3 bacterium RBG_13_43_14]|uniref:Glycosyltransferase RgtA/B/C/D-like domain-containing protein n=1 Tax=candidate division WOR-3 bacterium RBG_13_43_14 TaxID=1802590 RepID=A0A1F4UFI9_UNCW3|nr:MAG: hypothetical protein A2Y85_00195 [candidate division WOR-3 bacterium RBG_13_43_14]
MYNINKATYMLNEKINKTICRLAILGGIILRVVQFLYRRSLTEGEAPLAMNIIERSFNGLTKTLDYNQAAPIGFLMVEKLFTLMLGTGEIALRLFPLIAGIAALYLFYRLVKQTTDDTAVVFAMILFAVCDHIIYFTSEVKPYSTDVALTLIITLLGYSIIKSKSSVNLKYLLIFSFIAAISFWFSFPAVFIWLGIMSIIFYQLIKKQITWYTLIISAVIPAMSIFLYYLISLRFIANQGSLVNVWQSAFMPLPPRSFADIKWFLFVPLRMFKFPAGFSVYELTLALMCFLTGFIAYIKEKKSILAVLLLPILITMLASGFKIYPFEGRLLLFLTPALLMIISQGLSHIYKSLRSKSMIAAYALLMIFFLYPVGSAAYRLIKPRAPEELRPGLLYILEHQQTDDIIYVYYASENAFKYYTYQLRSIPEHIIGIESRNYWPAYYQDLAKLRGKKRVWVIMSHIARTFGVDEEKLFLAYLDELGQQQKYIQFPGAAVFLYDMSVPINQPILQTPLR